jgi:hypothetical protein
MPKKKETYQSIIELEKEPKPEPEKVDPPKPEPKSQSKPNSPEKTNADRNADSVLESLVGKMDGMDQNQKYEFIMKKANEYVNSLTTDRRLTEMADMERDRAIKAEIKMLKAQLKDMELEDEQKAAFEAAVAEADPKMVAGGRKKRKSKKRKPKKRKSKKRRTKRRTKRR